MKQTEHSRMIRQKILESSQNLFISKGYDKTTIREITAECGINIGSLYHFFKNKEDILYNLAIKVLEEAQNMIQSVPSKEPGLIFSLGIALQISFIFRHKKAAELYLAAYQSQKISETILQKGTEKNMELFSRYNPQFTEEDYYIRSIAIKGMLHSLVSELVSNRQMDLDNTIRTLITIMLRSFNVPEKKLHPILKETRSIIKKNTVTILHFRL